MRYIPISPDEQADMLAAIGLQTIDQLFSSVPPSLRLQEPLNLPPAHSEIELLRRLTIMAARNATSETFSIFLGAGAYHHYRPAHIDALITRSEFLTSYTPYQPEISQGTLQAIFEYQTLVCQLTGMEVANASLYDGSTAVTEAILMAHRLTRRRRVLVAASVHPEYREVARTLTQTLGLEIELIPYNRTTGQLDLGAVRLDASVAAVVAQSPNFFGVLENLEAISHAAHQVSALMVSAVAEPISLGLVRTPGEQGADIVAGEGQSLGIPLSFGGPYLGLFATRQEFIRQMPGRLAGEAYDHHGRRGFVLTLSTREQHIRREKATSNICTNQGLMMLIATIWMASLGRQGMKEIAWQNVQKASYAAQRIAALDGYERRFTGPHFNEFVVKTRRPVSETLARLQEDRIIGGLPLGRFYPELSDCLLVCVTEMNRREEIDQLVNCFDQM
ncbi:MAG: aminomethyl-transferring glycine dehydrogenase subunit GcvPA [Acidobacteriota bacterium]|nr:aminomethyl-transferring glycine dehydrogenase subunit GcvPA [Acidobacteriota bacterium]